MDNDTSMDINHDLASVRMERAMELIETAKYEFERSDYKSANNRAFYAMEKAVKALLALKGISCKTHSGVLKSFNKEYIFAGEGSFTKDDYKMIQEAETVRQASDYDDFYIVIKSDCIRQLNNAEYFVNKVNEYLARFLLR